MEKKWLLMFLAVTMFVASGVAIWLIFFGNQRVAQVDFNRGSASATSVTMTVTPAQQTYSRDAVFVVDITLDAATYSVSAADITVNFPSTILQAQSIASGSFLSSVLTAGTISGGTAKITVGSGTAAKTGSGVVAKITFRALADGSATISIDPSTAVAATGQSGNVLAVRNPATITIAPVLPTVSASVNKNHVKTGSMLSDALKNVTLSWSSANATSVSIDNSIGSVAPSGSRIISPTTTTTYKVTAVSASSSVDQQITITVYKACDVNRSGAVDIFDYNVLVGDYAKTGAVSGDIDEDLDVDIYDYNIFITNYSAQHG